MNYYYIYIYVCVYTYVCCTYIHMIVFKPYISIHHTLRAPGDAKLLQTISQVTGHNRGSSPHLVMHAIDF